MGLLALCTNNNTNNRSLKLNLVHVVHPDTVGRGTQLVISCLNLGDLQVGIWVDDCRQNACTAAAAPVPVI